MLKLMFCDLYDTEEASHVSLYISNPNPILNHNPTSQILHQLSHTIIHSGDGRWLVLLFHLVLSGLFYTLSTIARRT